MTTAFSTAPCSLLASILLNTSCGPGGGSVVVVGSSEGAWFEDGWDDEGWGLQGEGRKVMAPFPGSTIQCHSQVLQPSLIPRFYNQVSFPGSITKPDSQVLQLGLIHSKAMGS